MSTADQQGLTDKEKEKRSHAVVVSSEFCTVLLDIAFQRLLIKDGGDGSAEDENWVQEFSSASDFSQFRSRLVHILTRKLPPFFSTVSSYLLICSGFDYDSHLAVLVDLQGGLRSQSHLMSHGLRSQSQSRVTFNAVSDYLTMDFQVELVRHVASQQPVLAASKVAERLQSAFSSFTFESVSTKVWL